MEENNIKGGVIIMGSLFWEDETNCVADKEKEGKARRKWREKHLDMSKKEIIEVPIRYGRHSDWDNRRNTYTMVLSRHYLTRLGTAYVVPFKEKFSLNNTLNINWQIKRLAKVEGIYRTNSRVLAKHWAAIAIWFNPEGNDIQLQILREYWVKNIINKPNNGYAGKNYDWLDGSLIDNNYQLELPIDTKLDFLLCTYIKPKFNNADSDVNPPVNRQYPNAQTISNAIVNNNYSTYFDQNRQNEIITADDEIILQHI